MFVLIRNKFTKPHTLIHKFKILKSNNYLTVLSESLIVNTCNKATQLLL